ncbi:hypothetical protein [Priestia endophytica]|uniref:hypothetical protein n=1 Tax=Priestia endophytica TaxID=135735 RepID=UPI000F52537A|nr:hypothetical protein [Priestia endophytica]
MGIKVRNINPVAVERIDKMAGRKGIQRQEFLKKQIKTLTFFVNKRLESIIWKSSLTRTYSGKRLIVWKSNKNMG